jgi:hypothetical protein
MEPVKVLIPQNKMPFTLAVFMRLLVLIPIFGMSIFMIITGYRSIQEGMKAELITLISGIIFLLISSFLLINIFILKKRRLAQLQYLFYQDRLVIYNHSKGQILHELFYKAFPSFTFHENLNNFGFIVIGPEEPVLAKGGPFNLKWGVNMRDADIMLENLPEVKKEYLFLKELVEESIKTDQ